MLTGQITSFCFVPASLRILNREKDLNVKSIFYETNKETRSPVCGGA